MQEYKFYPNSYNYTLIKDKGIDLEHFLKLQIKYRNDFEKLLMGIFDFKKIDDYIDSFGKQIPTVNDLEYNFYHKFSLLGSKYIYFRNNIHIENLSLNEIEIINASIINDVDLDSKFLLETYSKVLYEDGDIVMFGIPLEKNEVFSKSLVFEFTYNQKEFSTVEQYNFVNEIVNVLLKSLRNSIKGVINTDISIISYNAIPDIYLNDL